MSQPRFPDIPLHTAVPHPIREQRGIYTGIQGRGWHISIHNHHWGHAPDHNIEAALVFEKDEEVLMEEPIMYRTLYTTAAKRLRAMAARLESESYVLEAMADALGAEEPT